MKHAEWFLAAAIAADVGTSYEATRHHNAREVNPIVASLGVDEHPRRFFAMGAANFAIIHYSTRALDKQGKRKLANVLRWVAVGIEMSVAIHNYKEFH